MTKDRYTINVYAEEGYDISLDNIPLGPEEIANDLNTLRAALELIAEYGDSDSMKTANAALDKITKVKK